MDPTDLSKLLYLLKIKEHIFITKRFSYFKFYMSFIP